MRLKLFLLLNFLCSIFYSSLLAVNHFSTEEQHEADTNEELEIHLETESNLIPVYLTDFSIVNTDFDPVYLTQLKKILASDLELNGYTVVISQTAQAKALEEKERGKEGINADAWGKLNASFVIKPMIESKQVTVRIYSVQEHSFKEIQSMKLTGESPKDRITIHQISDLIFESLFHKKGIASTHILYTIKLEGSSKTNQIAEVWEVDYDGYGKKQITNEQRLCVTPSYIPGKPGQAPSSFFYVCYTHGQPKIYVDSLKGGHRTALTDLKGNQLMPIASPKRDYAAFICDVSGNPDLFIQPFNPDTRKTDIPRQIFASVRGVQGSPSFSPDGKKICFVSNKDGYPRIYTMEIPPPGMPLKQIVTTMISKKNRENTSPSWSPDGTMIAYSSMTRGIRQIWLYDILKKEERQLTSGIGNKENPSWAPDSFHLVYNSDSAETGTELYIIDLNRKEPKKITAGKGLKRFPNWEPFQYQ